MKKLILIFITSFIFTYCPPLEKLNMDNKLMFNYKDYDYISKDRLLYIIDYVADRYNFNSYNDIVYAVIITESSRLIKAKGRHGEVGLMQITTNLLKDFNRIEKLSYNKDDMENPIKNISVGIWYLKQCIFKYKSIEKGLSAYNSGINSGKYKVKTYSKKVKKNMII